jgi:hypothetical protein
LDSRRERTKLTKKRKEILDCNGKKEKREEDGKEEQFEAGFDDFSLRKGL